MKQIPNEEFWERIKRIQNELAKRDLDALITFGDEAEPQNVRYLSDYWPAFETASVIVPVEGDPILVIGPESETFAGGWSRIRKIRRVLLYRESSEPEYPGEKLTSFEELFDEASNGKGIARLGIVGYNIMPASIYEAIRKAMKGGPVVRADDILINIRIIKSENEIKLMKEAYRLSELGMEATLRAAKPGMTEVQLLAEAEYAMKTNGAEDLGYNLWCLSGPRTTHAVGRPSHKKVQQGELIQLQIGARVGGYSSSIGRCFTLGHMSDEIKKLIKVALEVERKTMDLMKGGIVAKEVALKIRELVEKKGYGDYLLYGPCHGTGLLECEHPWIESTSEFLLKENMVFSVDTLLKNDRMGVRIEDGIRVTKEGVEELSNYRQEVICL